MLAAGDQAPEFTLPELGGGEGSLARSKPVLVTIYKVSCPTCQLALPFLNRLHASASLEQVLISQDDERATAAFRDAFGIGLRTLIDSRAAGYAVSNAFGIESVPAMFVVEPGGRISQAWTGFSKKDLEAVAARAGMPIFEAGESTPEWKPG